jgi:hypothetical protein
MNWRYQVFLVKMEALDRTIRAIEVVMLRLKRARCATRYHHVADASGVAKFRYDQSGICHDCGKVNSGR